MFFANDNISVSILDVMDLDQVNVVRYNPGRSFDALSFRIFGDTELITERGVHRVADNYVCYVPSGVSYTRKAARDLLIAVNCKISGYHSDDIECILPNDPEIVAKLFTEIYAVWNSSAPAKKHKCTALLYQVLAECFVEYNEKNAAISKIKNSVEYINSTFSSPSFSISRAAEKSYVSEVYFRMLFKSEYGISPQKYVISLRMDKATELIRNGDYSLKEIALMCGYNDYKYFSTEFKRVKGCSPSEYKQKAPV